ncbi:MAG: hypothetical protein B1H12_04910 [Desulfobacteraceae bacterium 4484_190.2]|nr:MAG: hypothetical protein B1H12_04910 [Desulfobacteraceae bacterium 4484_190.2]
MNINEVSLSSPIEEKIDWAEHCYKSFRGQLIQDKPIVDYLKRLVDAIQASHKEMGEAGILDICMDCEKNEGGSCCGAGLENKYDGWLLLINRLLDVRLPRKRHDKESCFFLGESGCLLKARHVICVNYLCKKITDRIDPDKLNALREKEGIELDILFLLNERLKRILRELIPSSDYLTWANV